MILVAPAAADDRVFVIFEISELDGQSDDSIFSLPPDHAHVRIGNRRQFHVENGESIYEVGKGLFRIDHADWCEHHFSNRCQSISTSFEGLRLKLKPGHIYYLGRLSLSRLTDNGTPNEPRKVVSSAQSRIRAEFHYDEGLLMEACRRRPELFANLPVVFPVHDPEWETHRIACPDAN